MLAWFSMQLLVNALIAGSLGALVACGLALVYGVLGIFNLALGQLVLVGGYSTWWLHHSAGLPLIPSIVGGLIIGGVVTAIVFEIFVGPFYRRHPFLPLVTTIAASMVLDALILLIFEERPRTILFGQKHFFDSLIIRLSVEQVVMIAGTIFFLLLVAWILHSTAFGRRIRASVEHADAARSLGISSALLHRIVFVTSGVLAAAAGIYIGIDQNFSPVIGFPMTIKAYAAVVAGGRRSLFGAVLAAYVIALLEQLAVGVPWWGGQYISAGYQTVVALAVIIIALLWKPEGLFGSRLRSV